MKVKLLVWIGACPEADASEEYRTIAEAVVQRERHNAYLDRNAVVFVDDVRFDGEGVKVETVDCGCTHIVTYVDGSVSIDSAEMNPSVGPDYGWTCIADEDVPNRRMIATSAGKTGIITHPGVFHADDAMAVALLKRLIGDLPVFRRSPTPSEIADPVLIKVDVGGQCDPRTHNYDHHQAGGAGARYTADGYGIKGKANPLAAAGLIWNTFPVLLEFVSEVEAEKAAFHARVDATLFRGIDATDCGVADLVEGGSPTLSRIVSWMNLPAGCKQEDQDEAFARAVALCGEALSAALLEAREFVRARSVVLAAAAEGNVLFLDKYVPWNEHLFSRPDEGALLYVICPSERGGYTVQQVPKQANSFEGRLPLPAEWAGLRDAAFAAVTGVADAMFCHPGRFIAGARSLEGTRALAAKALEALAA